MTDGLEAALADGLEERRTISVAEFIRQLAMSGVRHGGRTPSHCLATPSQVQVWVDECHTHLVKDHRLYGTRSVVIAGCRVIACAGPTRFIWSETLQDVL